MIIHGISTRIINLNLSLINFDLLCRLNQCFKNPLTYWIFKTNVFLLYIQEAKLPRHAKFDLFVPTFEKNAVFMLGVVFFIDQNNSVQQIFFIPH